MRYFIYLNLFILVITSLRAQNPNTKYQQGKYGIYDYKLNKWTTPPEYENINAISYGDSANTPISYFHARKKEKYRLIAADGKTLNCPEYFRINSINSEPHLFIVESNKLKGIYNAKLKKFVVPLVYSEITEFKKDSDWDSKISGYILSKKNACCLIDPVSFKPLSPEFDKIEFINREKLLFVVVKNKKQTIYNLTKGIVDPEIWFDSYELHSGGRFMLIGKENKYAIYDLENGKSSPFIYGQYLSYSGNQFIMQKLEKFGTLDSNYNTIIPFEYEFLLFPDYLSNICFAEKKGKWGIINSKGETTVVPAYDEFNTRRLIYLNEELHFVPVRKNGKHGIIDLNGNSKVELKYDTLYWWNSTCNAFCFGQNGKMGVVDSTGEELIPFSYKKIIDVNSFLNYPTAISNYFVYNPCENCSPERVESGWGIMDSKGELILDLNANFVTINNQKYSNVSEPGREASSEEKEIFNRLKDSITIGFLWNIGGVKTETLAFQDDSTEISDFDSLGNKYISKVAGMKTYSYNLIGGKTGVVSTNGKILIPIEYEDFSFNLYRPHKEMSIQAKSLSQNSPAYCDPYLINGDQNYFAKKNGKWGCFSWPNKELMPCRFDSITILYLYNTFTRYMPDSIFNKGDYHLFVYKAYLDNKVNYYSSKGKLLYNQPNNEKISALFYVNELFNATQAEDYLLVNINAADSFYTKSEDHIISEFDALGNEKYVKITQTFKYYIPSGGTLNFLNTRNFEFAFKEPVEDVIFITATDGVFARRWFDPIQRKDLYGSTVDGPYTNYIPGKDKVTLLDEPTEIGPFQPILFYKQSGKWYIRNLFERDPFNTNTPFDSIQIINTEKYKAFVNGKFNSFQRDFRGPFVIETELRFPDVEGMYNLVSKDCKYTYKTYMPNNYRMKHDQWGESIGLHFFKDTVVLPFVEKGKFNITDSSDNLVLKKWYDEILFPGVRDDYTFSITDTTSYLYQGYMFEEVGYQMPVNDCVKSIAVREGNSWKLMNIQDQNNTINGLESVSPAFRGWVVKKEGKKFLYYYNIYAEPESIEE